MSVSDGHPNPVLLEVSGVSVAFGGVQAVADATLRVAEGSICALIGPNGAGKTTLFSVVSGFQRPDAGWIRYAGNDITGMPPHQVCRRGIGRTFQIVQPFAGQSVLENIAIGSHLHRASRREALAHARQVAERLGLGAIVDRDAAALPIAPRRSCWPKNARNADSSRALLRGAYCWRLRAAK